MNCYREYLDIGTEKSGKNARGKVICWIGEGYRGMIFLKSEWHVKNLNHSLLPVVFRKGVDGSRT